jgi:hypothetical protein
VAQRFLPAEFLCVPAVRSCTNKWDAKPVNLSLQRHYSFLAPSGQSLTPANRIVTAKQALALVKRHGFVVVDVEGALAS